MTIQVSQALEILGARRVIWIDDRFNTTPAQLAELLTNSLETAQACNFAELQDALATYEIDAFTAVQTVAQILTDLSVERVEEIRTTFFGREKISNKFPTHELSADIIAKACELLGVAPEDRWTFEQADKNLHPLCATGDADLGYVVDLNESGGSPTRGLDMLRALWNGKSLGTAFILTHDTNIAGEAKKEIELCAKLSDLDGLGIPICVIAKERLSEKADDPNGVAEALRICVKRAGLRRSMHEVLVRAREKLQSAIDIAARRLLSIPPEQLESHVFERGYKEGVSELHVVERAITAHIGKETREFFGVDEKVHTSTVRLRALRAIELQKTYSEPDAHLSEFREAEVWESDELLNRALTPIACGDVFELDSYESATKASKRKFVLLGQPCDISLRPEDRKRAQDTAFLVPLKSNNSGNRDLKAPSLPFTIRGKQWACDFRNASVVSLAILDLASFREDGRVRFDEKQVAPRQLLVGQQNVFKDRIAVPSKALSDSSQRPAAGTTCIGLQLAFAPTNSFRHIYTSVFEDAAEQKVHGRMIVQPKRVTWRLRRCGRIRMPYASVLLDQYTTVMSRHAFELDYMASGPSEGIPVQQGQRPMKSKIQTRLRRHMKPSFRP